MFPSSVAKGFRLVLMFALFSPSIASSQVQQSALKASLKGTQATAAVSIGDRGTFPGASDFLPVNTLAYPDGQIAYRVEWGLAHGEVTQMEKSFEIGTTFQISSVDLKDDRLELKLLGRNSDSGRLKLMLGPGWQTKMSNEAVISVIGKFLTVPSAVTSSTTANSPISSAAIAPGSAATPVAPLKLPSTYVSAQTSADKLQLNTDNSFSLQEGGQPYHGIFVANGNALELSISETGTKTTLGRQGDDLTDSSGQTWRFQEQSAGTVSGGAMLHNEDIIKLAKAGLDDAIIISKITSSKCQFDTSIDALIQLKHGGVSAPVLRAMVGAGK